MLVSDEFISIVFSNVTEAPPCVAKSGIILLREYNSLERYESNQIPETVSAGFMSFPKTTFRSLIIISIFSFLSDEALILKTKLYPFFSVSLKKDYFIVPLLVL